MKKKALIFVFVCFTLLSTKADVWKPAKWPVLKSYNQKHLQQIALPLGGIGTGTVSLGGRGELRDWEIMNVPAKQFSTVTKGNNAPFFAINVRSKSGQLVKTKMLGGPLYDNEYLHYEGRPVNHHGLPRFTTASFDAAYPFGQVHLSTPKFPVRVTIKGFNPFIPTEADKSGLPIAVLSYEVTNTTKQPLLVSVCGNMRNFIGADGVNYTLDWKGDRIPIGAKKNKNRYKKGAQVQGIYMFSDGVKKESPAWGTIALTTQETEGVTYRTSSRNNAWENAILDSWDDFVDDGRLEEKYKDVDDNPMASLAVQKEVAPNTTETFTFYLTWNFPNRKAWSSTVVGNYYTTQYKDAWEAAEKIVPEMADLEKETLDFVTAFLSSTYPKVVKEAALFNLATLRSQTVFRLPSGHLMGWEGVMDHYGSCAGSCTHVWNYETATAFLFGDLARTMRDVEFNYSTADNGAMRFRANLPLRKEKTTNYVAADGQMGCIMKAYREWQLFGEKHYLSKNWPQIKKAMAYAWIEKGWDANQDGVMEGVQHNTMDVNYYGPNPQMGFWYLGALRAAEEMAREMKDLPFEKKCHRLFVKGAKWIDKNLYNGAYYEQKITDPKSFEFLDMADSTVKIPDFQLYKGCLVDQLVGQYMAHICGLGYLGDKEHLVKTLKSIYQYNFLTDFSDHFNNMRSYVMGDEAGLLMASWPKGRLKVPFPYFSEVMTGFEYCAATSMIYEGLEKNALSCVKAIRKRHDGAKRNPFSEPECGHHYARSMASWSLILAGSEFQYSAVEKRMNFTNKPGIYFWSNGYAFGTCHVMPSRVTLSLLKGNLKLNKLTLSEYKKPVGKDIVMKAGEKRIFEL